MKDKIQYKENDFMHLRVLPVLFDSAKVLYWKNHHGHLLATAPENPSSAASF